MQYQSGTHLNTNVSVKFIFSTPIFTHPPPPPLPMPQINLHSCKNSNNDNYCLMTMDITDFRIPQTVMAMKDKAFTFH
jgi:hypothetical protein